MSFRSDIKALERATRRVQASAPRDESADVLDILRQVPLEENPGAQLALGARATYPDGRTVPQVGDEVFTAIPGMFGSTGSMSGTVVQRRGGRIAVQVRETSSLLGGKQRLARARFYPLFASWTVRGEKGAHTLAEEKSAREHEEWSKKMRQGDMDRQATFEHAQAAARADGRLLSDVKPQAGMRVRYLRTGQTATVQKRRTKPLTKWERFDPARIDVRFDGERYRDYEDEVDGEKIWVEECDEAREPDEWEVIR